MSKLLIDELPLIVLPSLAAEFGLHESIFLQQLHYWMEHKGPDGRRYGKVADDRRWIRNAVRQWRETNFTFMSDSAIYRTIKSLEKTGVVVSRSDLNAIGYDRTKWYTIDYAILQIREMEFSFSRNRIHDNGEPIPENTPESTEEKTLSPSLKSAKTANEKLAREIIATAEIDCNPDIPHCKWTDANFDRLAGCANDYGFDHTVKCVASTHAKWCATEREDGNGYYNPHSAGWLEERWLGERLSQPAAVQHVGGGVDF